MKKETSIKIAKNLLEGNTCIDCINVEYTHKPPIGLDPGVIWLGYKCSIDGKRSIETYVCSEYVCNKKPG